MRACHVALASIFMYSVVACVTEHAPLDTADSGPHGGPAKPGPEDVTSDGGDPSKGDIEAPGQAPLNVFYVIHLHLGNDRYPYESKQMQELNATKAKNMLAIVEAIKGIADKHGLKIAWQPTVGPAKGFCVHQGGDHIFKSLLADGHGIGIHAHDDDDLEPTYSALTGECGLEPSQITTASGYQAFLGKRSGGERTAAFTEAVKDISSWGIHVGTSNLAPDSDGDHEMAPICTTTWGDNTESWRMTDNLLLPWKPDVANAIPCDHDAGGIFVMVDHSGPEWMVTEAGKGNVVTHAHFDQLRVHFDATLEVMAAGTEGRVAAWGFVTHISEFTMNDQAEGPPDQGALDALDAFLSYLDTKRDQGLITYGLPSAIAREAYPDVF